MRRFLTGFVVAALCAVIPALAMAGNQEIAEQIASRLRTSGQMSDYRIGVKYQDGTAWVRGTVTSSSQMKTALGLVFETASVDRIVNELTVVSPETAKLVENEPARINADSRKAETLATPAGYNPLRDPEPAPAANTQIRQTRMGLAKRLEMAWKSNREVPQPQQVEEEPTYADEMPNADTPSEIQQVAAEEPQELPRQLAAPKRAQPMARMPARVAMQQTRGPMAPNGAPLPMYSAANAQAGVAPARYDQPCMPNYAWPSYAAYPNYAAVTYPKQYSPTAWPYIGPFYPYPQVPMGWRKVTLEWDDGWWFLDFKDQPASCWHR